MNRRPLPPADYVYVLDGRDLLPAVVLKRGRVWTRVLRFKPFDGSKAARVRTRDVFDLPHANALLAFREDPMAVLHMTGEHSTGRALGEHPGWREAWPPPRGEVRDNGRGTHWRVTAVEGDIVATEYAGGNDETTLPHQFLREDWLSFSLVK